jgi:hypothetical protein
VDKNKKCCWNCKFFDREAVGNLRGNNGYRMADCFYKYELPKLPECVEIIINNHAMKTCPVYGERCEVFEKRV